MQSSRRGPIHVLFGPYSRYTWGHLVRTLAVADVLARTGARITFACGLEARRDIRRSGYRHYLHDAMVEQRLLRASSARDIRAATRRFGAELDALRVCVRRERPDVVVSDLQPLLNVAAALECVPSASMLNLELLPWPLEWWLPGFARVLGALEIPQWAATRMFGDALAVVDAPDPTGLRDLSPAQATSITSSVREIRFVGPVVRSAPGVVRRRPARGRRLVLISMGQTGGGALEHVLRGCAEIDANFLVVDPNQTPAVRAAVKALGRRARLVGFLPEFDRVLRDAAALVTHGGHGTLIQALSLAVPTIVVPMSLEREINGKRLRGLGQVTSPNPSQVRETIAYQLDALLRDREGDRARAAEARRLRALGGAAEVARLVQRLAA